MAASTDDLTALSVQDIEARLEDVRQRMRPVEAQLTDLRGERDLLLTEMRRRERLQHREKRASAREAIKTGSATTLVELVAATDEGGFDDYAYHLRTGGTVRLGFPGARAQTVAWTDGQHVAQARDFSECARYYAAGWQLGSPGRPGVRVHFPGTRQERLVEADDVFASTADGE